MRSDIIIKANARGSLGLCPRQSHTRGEKVILGPDNGSFRISNVMLLELLDSRSRALFVS